MCLKWKCHFGCVFLPTKPRKWVSTDPRGSSMGMFGLDMGKRPAQTKRDGGSHQYRLWSSLCRTNEEIWRPRLLWFELPWPCSGWPIHICPCYWRWWTVSKTTAKSLMAKAGFRWCVDIIQIAPGVGTQRRTMCFTPSWQLAGTAYLIWNDPAILC